MAVKPHYYREVILAICVLVVTLTTVASRRQDTFKAAVYIHRPIWPDPSDNSTDLETAKDFIRRNLEIYEKQAKMAAKQDAEIIVFPEYGLHPPKFHCRVSALHFLENIPDPLVPGPGFDLNPCEEYSDNDTSILVQYSLSCMAKKYKLYVAANTGRYSECDSSDGDCEIGTKSFYSTNVVYDPEGAFIMRSDKYSLSKEFEPFFERPPSYTRSFFNVTGIGSFGTFTTGDVLVYYPGMDVIETGKKLNQEPNFVGILYPTAWVNQRPFMESVGFHSSVAMATGVNILAAGLHLPEQGLRGGGIYSGAYGEIGYCNEMDDADEGKLKIEQLSIKPHQKEEEAIVLPEKSVDCEIDSTALIHGDQYKIRKLCQKKGELTLETGDVTCHLAYKQPTISSSNDSYYALAIFDGMHEDLTASINGYLQVCALVSCSPDGACGQEEATAIIDDITLIGNFRSLDTVVMPSVIFMGNELDSSFWDFVYDPDSNSAKITIEDLEEPLNTAVLFGRRYSRDTSSSQTRVQASATAILITLLLTLRLTVI